MLFFFASSSFNRRCDRSDSFLSTGNCLYRSRLLSLILDIISAEYRHFFFGGKLVDALVLLSEVLIFTEGKSMREIENCWRRSTTGKDDRAEKTTIGEEAQ